MSTRWLVPLSITLLAACAPRNTAPDPDAVPTSLVPPSGNQEFLRAIGRGVQIYTCQAGGWTLKAPEAILKDDNFNVVARHGAGPSWTAPDNSSAVGTRLASVNSPDPAAIPWLLLRAKTSGEGTLARTTYVQRLNTVGGLAPASGCDSAHLSAETRVNYSATYVFFRQ